MPSMGVMVSSKASTVEQYLAELGDDRREAIIAIRDVVLAHLPAGYVEVMNWGMITYEVPLDIHPDTYNKRPLMYAALASQKNHMALYLTNVFSDPDLEQRFRAEYKASGCKLDMGKSCVRFRSLDQVPLELIGETIAHTSVETFIEMVEAAR